MGKVLATFEQLVEEAAHVKVIGGIVTVTNGCFDLLHRGHADYLAQAKHLYPSTRLFVLVNSDASVRALKGTSRPINNQLDRAALLAALECVDFVFIFDSLVCARELAALHPDVYVKGGDYKIESLNREERDALKGAIIKIMPVRAGISTSALVERIRSLI